MNPKHFDALLALEVRRVSPLLLRILLAMLGVVLLFTAFGKGTAENILAAIIGTSLATVLAVPLTVSRDKLEGTLAFLRSLPASTLDLTAARFAAGASSVLPGAILTGISLAILERPAELAFLFSASFFTVTAGWWAALAVTSWCLIAIPSAPCEGSSAERDQDVVAFHLHLVGLHRPDRREGKGLTRLQVEAGTVPGALDGAVLHDAVRQRVVLVGAVVAQGVECAVRRDGQTHARAVYVHLERFARLEVRHLRHLHEL